MGKHTIKVIGLSRIRELMTSKEFKDKMNKKAREIMLKKALNDWFPPDADEDVS